MSRCILWTACFFISLCWGSASSFLSVRADDGLEPLIAFLGVGGTGSEVAHVIGFIRPDGTGEFFPDFRQNNQRSWVIGPLFADGRRLMLSSYEDTNLTQVRSGQVMTHDWIYDFSTGEVVAALQKERQAAQLRPYALLSGDERVIETAIIGGEERIFIKDLDGANPVELTTAGGGFHYALALSHDHSRLACHVTGGAPSFYNPGMYSINVFDLATGKRTLVAGQSGHLMFGPQWSPDDTQLVYLDCHAVNDPKHFRAALAVGQADGSGHRLLTPGQTHWFGTPFGSNMSAWSPEGDAVLYTRLQENATAEMVTGGSQLCLLNVTTGAVTELTPAIEGTWDFRGTWSPDGGTIAFARVQNGSVRELWLMQADGANPRKLTDGYQHKGADHFRWLRVRR
ncbi:MAG: PD40 domain-containing protein [Planctomycetaceae bacterium]|nr:PD40 domain-containing protein [Planctomycetaceae bacterium]